MNVVKVAALASFDLFAVAGAGDPSPIANADIHRCGFLRLSVRALTAHVSHVAAISHCSLSWGLCRFLACRAGQR